MLATTPVGWFLVGLATRWAHVLASTYLVGGYAVLLSNDPNGSSAAWSAFRKTLHASLAVIVVSGLYNWWALQPKRKALGGTSAGKLYNGLAHLKIVLGVASFPATVFLPPRSAALLLIGLILMGGLMRQVREEHSVVVVAKK